jgi:hypothetical protein
LQPKTQFVQGRKADDRSASAVGRMGPGESGISPAFHLSLSKLRDLHFWYRSAAEKEQAAAMLTLMRLGWKGDSGSLRKRAGQALASPAPSKTRPANRHVIGHD